MLYPLVSGTHRYDTTLFVLDGSMFTLLLINLICAFVALGVGFAAGVWFFGGQSSGSRRSSTSRDHEAQRQAERAMMASSRLRDLAKGIATDIGTHSTEVQGITATLRDVERAPSAVDDVVCSAIEQIIVANGKLQKQLKTAEQHIATQAAEIRVHETEARTDSLTMLANRRAFDDELQRRFAEWTRKKTPLSLVLMDIDHFKRFNDTHGHQAGDDVLRTVGRVLTAVSREMDVPCRYGGEEFALILPATDVRDARGAAERLRVAVEDSETKWEGKTLRVTTSIGLAQAREMDTVAQLIKRADEALYQSKETGRNRGHWHDGSRCLALDTDPESVPGEVVVSAHTTANGVSVDIPDQGVFVDELRRRLAESHRFGIPLSVLYLTLDQLARVQQERGTAVAQLAVETVIQAIATTLREMDLLARWDAGHLAIMLPGSSDIEAKLVAKRLQTVMRTCVVPFKGGQLKLGLHFGVAQVQSDDTVQTLMTRAQEASKAPDYLAGAGI